MQGRVSRQEFDIEATDAELIFFPKSPSVCDLTFHVEIDPSCKLRDLVFLVKGVDFEGVCNRNPNLTPSASLEGAYAYSPNAETGAQITLGPIRLEAGDNFSIRTWQAAGKARVDELIRFVGLAMEIEGGTLVRRLV